MSETETETEKKVTKRPAKKAAKKAATKRPTKKAAVRKPAAKKAEAAVAKPARKTAKRGRPAGKKPATRRGKKGAKQFAYLLLTAQEDGSQKASTMNGPFASETDALDDASIMADENTTIVLFRETKRGKVQKSTKFVAGR